jgi:hypothetical protein
MAYYKARLKGNGDKASLVLDRFEYGIHQANIYLHRLYYRFHLNTF